MATTEEHEEKRRRDLPRTMTPEAWVLLAAIEEPKKAAKAEAFAKFKAKEAERKAADPEAYKVEKRNKAKVRRKRTVLRKTHKGKLSGRRGKKLHATR